MTPASPKSSAALKRRRQQLICNGFSFWNFSARENMPLKKDGFSSGTFEILTLHQEELDRIKQADDA